MLAPVTSWRSSSAVGFCPSDQSSRRSEPASLRVNHALPNFSRRIRAELRLERPRAEVLRGVEAVVDVGEVVGVARRHLQRVGEQLDVAPAHRGHVGGGVELDLVQELRAVAPHEPEQLRRALGGELGRAREVEAARQPHRVDGQVLEQHRPALGDGVVAEPPLLDGQRRRHVREVLGVAGLVEEGAPVVRSALRLDHEDDAAGNLDRDAERARRLVRPLLEVELDVLLPVQVDAEVGQRRLERGQHPVLRERVVPGDTAPDARDIPPLDLAETEADAGAEGAVAGLLPHPLRRVEEVAALLGQAVEVEAEAAVELGVVRARRAVPSHGGRPARSGGRADSSRTRSARSVPARAARASAGPARCRCAGAASGTGPPRRRRAPSATPPARPPAPTPPGRSCRDSPRRRTSRARACCGGRRRTRRSTARCRALSAPRGARRSGRGRRCP